MAGGRPPDSERAGAARCGERASFDFGYDLPAGCGVYGTLEDEIGLSVDGAPVADWIVVSGIAVDNPLLYSDNSAPKAEISENIVKFGPVKRSSGPSMKWISLRNTGERPLTVQAVEPRIRLYAAAGCADRRRREAQVGIRLTPSDCEYGVAVGADPHRHRRSRTPDADGACDGGDRTVSIYQEIGYV